MCVRMCVGGWVGGLVGAWVEDVYNVCYPMNSFEPKPGVGVN